MTIWPTTFRLMTIWPTTIRLMTIRPTTLRLMTIRPTTLRLMAIRRMTIRPTFIYMAVYICSHNTSKIKMLVRGNCWHEYLIKEINYK
jgi:hypothetical protein